MNKLLEKKKKEKKEKESKGLFVWLGMSGGIHNAVLGVLQYVYDHTPTPWPNVISF